MQTDRQTDRQAGRQAGRQADRQAGSSQPDRRRQRETERETDMRTWSELARGRGRQKHQRRRVYPEARLGAAESMSTRPRSAPRMVKVVLSNQKPKK